MPSARDQSAGRPRHRKGTMAKRRRKTPETDVGARIRTYAATYAASGQKERAEGMLQAADLVDQALVGADLRNLVERATADITKEGGIRIGRGDEVDVRDLARRVAHLERQVLKPEVGAKNGKPQMSPFLWVDADGNQHRSPRSDGGSPELAKGATSILSAVMGMPAMAASIDEIIALVGLKQTSARKYVGDLVAAGYAKQEAGRVRVTEAGAEVRVTAWNCYGQALFEWWLGRLSAGENLILRYLRNQACTVPGLVAEPGIPLKQTSIRKYLGDLQRRRLIVRTGGGYELAPILREGAV